MLSFLCVNNIISPVALFAWVYFGVDVAAEVDAGVSSFRDCLALLIPAWETTNVYAPLSTAGGIFTLLDDFLWFRVVSSARVKFSTFPPLAGPGSFPYVLCETIGDLHFGGDGVAEVDGGVLSF